MHLTPCTNECEAAHKKTLPSVWVGREMAKRQWQCVACVHFKESQLVLWTLCQWTMSHNYVHQCIGCILWCWIAFTFAQRESRLERLTCDHHYLATRRCIAGQVDSIKVLITMAIMVDLISSKLHCSCLPGETIEMTQTSHINRKLTWPNHMDMRNVAR